MNLDGMISAVNRLLDWLKRLAEQSIPSPQLPRGDEWLSDYFQRKEFECRCGCGFDLIRPELVKVLTDVRRYFDKPVRINSGCRCKQHNVDVGGTERSKHMLGAAADITVDGVEPIVVAGYLESLSEGKRWGIGKYNSFTHLDVRQSPARWDERT